MNTLRRIGRCSNRGSPLEATPFVSFSPSRSLSRYHRYRYSWESDNHGPPRLAGNTTEGRFFRSRIRPRLSCHHWSNVATVHFTTTSSSSEEDSGGRTTTVDITPLRDLLRKTEHLRAELRTGEEDPDEFWTRVGELLRDSLRELRVLRARDERLPESSGSTTTERIQGILDALVMLDRLAESLPREEYYSSSYLSNATDDDASTVGFLDTHLLNELLKEWMMGWKLNPQDLPSPSQMAEKVDRYRSRFLVQPDPTSFNLLLNAMIYGNASSSSTGAHGINHRIKAMRLADDYLRRLVQAQKRFSGARSSSSNYVDPISITTVVKGWVDLGQPSKAEECLTLAKDARIPLNAVAYATLIHGWAKRGEAHQAESLLERALQEATTMDDDSEEARTLAIDRVVFHTVLDAWAVMASRANRNRSASGSSGSSSDESVLPSLRAKALVQQMNDLADEFPSRFGHLRPNDETWHKLIAVVATSSSGPNTSSSSKEVGPRAAERLLEEFERKHKANHDSNNSPSVTPGVLLNRILQAYCACGTTMKEAEAFYHRRCQLVEGEESSNCSPTNFPNEVTYNTILAGLANAAKVASKKQSKQRHHQGSSKKFIAEIPLRAEAWLEKMEQHGGYNPSPRSYGSVLQAWSLSTQQHPDAADRAERMLRQTIWPMLEEQNQEDRHRDVELAKGIVICTNIVLRTWSNQLATASATSKATIHSVGKSLVLLRDFLELVDTTNQTKTGIRLQPTEETFRAVLHAICTPSKGAGSMTPEQKHDHAKAVLACMKETFRIPPSKADLKKLERLKKRRDAFLERRSKQ